MGGLKLGSKRPFQTGLNTHVMVVVGGEVDVPVVRGLDDVHLGVQRPEYQRTLESKSKQGLLH